MIINAAKSIGKEFLANKAADILKETDKSTPTETAQNDIPVDLSEITSMEDTYEPTVSDADENDPGVVDLSDAGQSFMPQYDFSSYIKHNDDVGQNDAFADYLKKMDAENDNEDSETSIIDDLNSRLENSDTGIYKDKDWASQIDEDSLNDMIYAKAQDGDWLAKRYWNARDRAKGGSFNDREKLKSWKGKILKNIENNPEWKDYWDKGMSSENVPTYDQLFGNRVSDIKDLPLTDEEYEKLSATELEQVTEEHPEKVQEDLPNTPIAEEASQITEDDDKRNDEVNNEAAEETVELLDDMPLVSGYRREGDKLLDEYGNEIPDYESIDTDSGVLTERDDDFLGQDEWVDEEGNIHEYSELANGNTEALDKKWYEGDDGGEGEYSESGNVNLDYEAAELQDQIKEAEALPVTNAEEAKEKQNKLRALRLKLKEVQTATGSGSNIPSKGPTTDNGIQTTGGRVSPRAGIGSIGGGASGHGSMSSTRPTKMGDSHNSIASKAPLPHALEDNQGRVVSVNGKATTAPSSNNNGAFRSGSFGLMSKAKSNLESSPSKVPVSSGPEHMGNVAMTGDFNLEDGKQILIERLKQLLTQLTDEEKKQMGFSPALNQWNGKALIRLDGYTLQDLIDKVEKYLEEK